jgi:acetylornithine deacetylase/succinyl-diaminopimelate desuccinylase-like protein
MIIAILLLLIAVLLSTAWYSKRYRAQSFAGVPVAAAGQQVLADRLQAHVQMLAGRIGERNMWHPERLEQAARYIEAELAAAGCAVEAHSYTLNGHTVRNIVARIEGHERPQEIG